MSPTKSEDLLKTYKCLAKVPQLASARHLNENVVQASWSGRNLELGRGCIFQTTFLPSEGGQWTSLPPVDISTQSMLAVSPCKTYRAILRDVEQKDKEPAQYLEVWTESALIRSVDLGALDIHGNVYTDGEFSSFQWSPVGRKLLYVAEKKVPKADPLNKRQKPKKDSEIDEKKPKKDIIQLNTYRQDWGEALVGKVCSIIVVYDFDADDFSVLEGIPENVCVEKPFWTADGEEIIGVCIYTEPRKLGLMSCGNRHSNLFTLTLDGCYEEFANLKNKTVRTPLLTPDGTHVVWFQCEVGGPHLNCMQVYKAKLPLSSDTEPELVVDYVEVSKEINDGKLFYGVYYAMIPERCWSKDGRLLFSTYKQTVIATYVLDIETGKLTELEFSDGSQHVLDVFEDSVLINRKNFLQQDVLLKGTLPPTGEESAIVLEQVSKTNALESLKDKTFEYLELAHGNGDEVDNFTAIYVGPKCGENGTVPVIVYPHGGPHSAEVNAYSLEYAFLLTLGYALVFVNYRGSLGAGQKSLAYLLGRCGDADVADCILTTTTVLEKYPWLSSKRMSLMGGSHGGFLIGHLSGRYPDMWRAVVAVNAALDIATMCGGTDIPDWCYVESGFEFTQVGEMRDDILLAMRRCSPIVHAHKVKAPTLLQIGTKDLRAVCFQEIDYYHRLKANNVTASMNVYEDNHPLGQIPNEIGNILSSAKWLEEHSA